MGGGFPVGAYAASSRIMACISPEGPVYQGGTLSGNPVAMAAGIAQLKLCMKPGFYEALENKTTTFVNEIKDGIGSLKNVKIHTLGSIFWISFSSKENIRCAVDIDPESMKLFSKFYHRLLENGIYLGPSGYEVGFISAAHTTEELQKASAIFVSVLRSIAG